MNLVSEPASALSITSAHPSLPLLVWAQRSRVFEGTTKRSLQPPELSHVGRMTRHTGRRRWLSWRHRTRNSRGANALQRKTGTNCLADNSPQILVQSDSTAARVA